MLAALLLNRARKGRQVGEFPSFSHQPPPDPRRRKKRKHAQLLLTALKH